MCLLGILSLVAFRSKYLGQWTKMTLPRIIPPLPPLQAAVKLGHAQSARMTLSTRKKSPRSTITRLLLLRWCFLYSAILIPSCCAHNVAAAGEADGYINNANHFYFDLEHNVPSPYAQQKKKAGMPETVGEFRIQVYADIGRLNDYLTDVDESDGDM
jgi:hypothetical protein